MAYTQPTTADFKARYPQFASVSDALVQLVLDESAPLVGESWLERDRRPALMLLVAHKLTLEGEPGRSTTIAAGGVWSDLGVMKRRKVGDTEVDYQNANERLGTGGIGTVGKAGYELTPFGREFQTYLRRNFSSVAVV